MDQELRRNILAEIKGHTEMIETSYRCPKCGSIIKGKDDIQCLSGTRRIQCKCGYCDEFVMS